MRVLHEGKLVAYPVDALSPHGSREWTVRRVIDVIRLQPKLKATKLVVDPCHVRPTRFVSIRIYSLRGRVGGKSLIDC